MRIIHDYIELCNSIMGLKFDIKIASKLTRSLNRRQAKKYRCQKINITQINIF